MENTKLSSETMETTFCHVSEVKASTKHNLLLFNLPTLPILA